MSKYVYLIEWNPYPGEFWVPGERWRIGEGYSSNHNDQFNYFVRRGLAFPTIEEARLRACALNDALKPLLKEVDI